MLYLIEVSPERKYIIDSKNLPKIKDFCKLFNINFKIIQTDREPLPLKELAFEFCNNIYAKNIKKPSKSKIGQVYAHIQSLIDSESIINLKDIKNKFSSITPSYIYNTFYNIKKNLERSGRKIERIGCGQYKITS